jgi:hypothetical protein
VVSGFPVGLNATANPTEQARVSGTTLAIELSSAPGPPCESMSAGKLAQHGRTPSSRRPRHAPARGPSVR